MSQSHKTITLLNNSLHGDSYSWNFGDGDSSKEKSATHKYRVHGDYVLTYKVTNKCGSKDTSYTVVVENLGVEDMLDSKVFVYPNPATKNLTIEFATPIGNSVVAKLFTIEGGEVKTWLLEGNSGSKNHIELQGIAKGTYLLHINTPDGLITKRIVKL